jgi:DNA-binding HxlR family transcriptional regulator
MRWEEIRKVDCSVARSLSVVGDRWTLLILRDCFLGARRFEQFQQSIGLSPYLLSNRLAKLRRNGILERRPYQKRPVRYEYRLTEKGHDLYPVIVSLLRWGDHWMPGKQGPPFDLVHRQCGHKTTPTLTCSECGDVLRAREMTAKARTS